VLCVRLKIARDEESSQDTDALRHWTERRRELLLVERLDALVAVLGKLVAALERGRAA
jgi:hypothetical protein